MPDFARCRTIDILIEPLKIHPNGDKAEHQISGDVTHRNRGAIETCFLGSTYAVFSDTNSWDELDPNC